MMLFNAQLQWAVELSSFCGKKKKIEFLRDLIALELKQSIRWNSCSLQFAPSVQFNPTSFFLPLPSFFHFLFYKKLHFLLGFPNKTQGNVP